MSSDLEQISLAGLALNDSTNFSIEELSFKPAEKKPQWAGNADADGEVLARESHYTNAFFEAAIRVAPQETDTLGREKLGELTDALQACERIEGGAELLWTPNGGSVDYIGYALLGEHSEIPITMSGDLAGWFLRAPIVKVKLTLRPFFETEERQVLEPTESGAEPLQTLYVPGIKGDVQAEARLVLKDTATQDRRYAQVGRDVVESEEGNPTLLLKASTDLVSEGFSGESKTRSGAYGSEKVIRATAISSATTMAGTGRIAHVGSYAVYLRVYAPSEDARFRISYRNGDGPLIPLEWQEPPISEGFSDISMGEVFLDNVTLGEQTSEIWIEIKSAGSAIALDLNYLTLIPTVKGSGRARGLASNNPTTLLAYDEFDQSEGNLEGKTLPLGGTWAGASETGENGFKVNASDQVAERAQVRDSSLLLGAYAIAGSEEPQTALIAGDFATTALVPGSGEGMMRLGLLARYTDPEHFLFAGIVSGGAQGHAAFYYLEVRERVPAGEVVFGKVRIGVGLELPTTTVTLNVAANGSWRAEAGGKTLEGLSPEFAAGGYLEKGKVGIYDAWLPETACTRTVEHFSVVAAEEPGVVCYSGKEVEFRSDGVLRQDATATYDGPPDLYRGANFYLEPEGDRGAINRLAVRMRRNDIEEEVDANVTDKQSVEVLATERFLLPR